MPDPGSHPSDRIDLAEPATAVPPIGVDPRPRMPEPPPVRLAAIADVKLLAKPGTERELDRLYVEVLGFQRVSAPGTPPIYQAENAALTFTVIEDPRPRPHLRMIAVEVPSLADTEQRLVDRGIEFQWQKSLQPGLDSILVLDAGGNWVEVRERVLFR